MGFVYFVGAGPGDSELITLKGINAIKKADVILYDALVNEELLNYAKQGANKIFVGKTVNKHCVAQSEINALLLEYAKGKNVVVRLKGGDPFVFGRGGEEAKVLDENIIPYAFIPGVSSCYSVPELAGIPVTQREVSRDFAVIAGHTKENKLDVEAFKTYAKLNGTLVFLMGVCNIENIADLLIKFGKSENTPVAVIASGSTASEKIVRGTLQSISSVVEKEKIKPPAVIVVGEVANYNFTKKVNIGVTGSEKIQNDIRSLADFANVYSLLSMQFKALEFDLPNVSKYDAVAFTSENAVDFFFGKVDKENFRNLKLCAIGPKTASAVKKYGFEVSVIPKEYNSRSLANEIVKHGFKDVILVKCKKSSTEVETVLDENGVNFDVVNPYDSVVTLGKDADKIDLVNYIAFASSSSAHAFFENYGVNKNVKYVAIGDVTASALKSYGIAPIVSKEYVTEGIVKAIWEDLI